MLETAIIRLHALLQVQRHQPAWDNACWMLAGLVFTIVVSALAGSIGR